MERGTLSVLPARCRRSRWRWACHRLRGRSRRGRRGMPARSRAAWIAASRRRSWSARTRRKPPMERTKGAPRPREPPPGGRPPPLRRPTSSSLPSKTDSRARCFLWISESELVESCATALHFGEATGDPPHHEECGNGRGEEDAVAAPSKPRSQKFGSLSATPGEVGRPRPPRIPRAVASSLPLPPPSR